MDQHPSIAAPTASGLSTQRLWHILVVAGLSATCLYIAEPFLSAATWAVILAVSAWPGFVQLRRALGNRPRVAACIFVVAGIVVLILPLVLVGMSAAQRAPEVTRGIEYVEQNGVPGPPDAVAHLPLVGPRLHAFWAGVSKQGSEVLAQYRTEINATAAWLLRRAGSFGMTLLQFALAIVIAALLLARVEKAVGMLRAFAVRVGGQEALDLLPLIEHTIRAVSFGVVGTSLVEGVLSGIGFAIAGVPAAILLGCATFLLCLLQAGPGFVFVPVAAWMWWQGDIGWAIFVLAWNIVLALPIEMFGRPFFISRGTGLPMLVIFVGVLGGLLAFGFIGVFVGAAVLAVSYTMLLRWLAP